MIVRMCFKKYGAMKFIGHLDVMRYFQKAFRRAKYDVKYSQGYNPHMILSFALPLGVGVTSDKEYLDVELNSSLEPIEMINKINQVLTEGFLVTDFIILNREEHNKIVPAMALVTDADYLISLKDGYEIPFIHNQFEFIQKFKEFYNQDEIMVLKKTKKSEINIDIKPHIHAINFEEFNLSDSVADVFENGIKVRIQLAAGSVDNIKPDLVMKAFSEYFKIEFNEYAYQYHRFDTFTRDKTGKIIPLNKFND